MKLKSTSKLFSPISIVIVVLLVLILASQGYIIYTAANPAQVWAQKQEKSLIEHAASLAKVQASDLQSMAEVGKSAGFEDLEKLRKGSRYNEEVYKDAKSGDRAMAFSSKMILYRPSEKKIIYEGQTPGQKQTDDQKAEILKIVDVVKRSGYVDPATTEVPQIATVSNIEELKGNSLYAGAANGDLVMLFNKESVIVVYSIQGQKILNAAKSTLVPLPSPVKR